MRRRPSPPPPAGEGTLLLLFWLFQVAFWRFRLPVLKRHHLTQGIAVARGQAQAELFFQKRIAQLAAGSVLRDVEIRGARADMQFFTTEVLRLQTGGIGQRCVAQRKNTRLGSYASSANGLPSNISRNWAGVLTITAKSTFRCVCSKSCIRTAASSAANPLSSAILPLCIHVRTLSKPLPPNTARTSAILTAFFPLGITPRRNAIRVCLLMVWSFKRVFRLLWRPSENGRVAAIPLSLPLAGEGRGGGGRFCGNAFFVGGCGGRFCCAAAPP